MTTAKPAIVKSGNPESDLITSLRIALPVSLALWVMIIMLAKILMAA